MTTTLKVDYDTRDWGLVEKRIARCLDFLRPIATDGRVARTGKGYHVEIDVRGSFSRSEVIDLQDSLGDDRSRVRMNRVRAAKRAGPGRGSWNRLWQTKFTLDGVVRMTEEPAPGETKWLNRVLFDSDTAFRRMR